MTNQTQTTGKQRSIVYARVSTSQQANSGLGIEAQIAKCKMFAELNEYVPITTITDDGISGSIAPDNRPGLADALQLLDNGDADILIVSSLSRLGRRTSDVLALADRAAAGGWNLAILDMNLDSTTSVGRCMLTMLAAISQLERDQISERTTAALQQKKLQGARLGAPASDLTRTAGKRALEIRESEGLSWQKIADILTAENYERAGGTSVWNAMAASRAANTIKLDIEATENRAKQAG